ncbi:unnamed protein product, partial [Prorocentrum cordatum]
VRAADRVAVEAEALLRWERAGFARCPSLLSEREAQMLRRELECVMRTEAQELAALRHQVRVQLGAPAARRCRTRADCRALLRDAEECGEVSFLQYFNLHRASAPLRAAALSARMSFWASKLLGVPQSQPKGAGRASELERAGGSVQTGASQSAGSRGILEGKGCT